MKFRIIENYKYCYYPNIHAVTKSNGCDFFNSERGFIFDIDGDWILETPLGPLRKYVSITAEEALNIVDSDDYCFLFWGKKMDEE